MKILKKLISIIFLVLILSSSIYFGIILIKSKTYESPEVIVDRIENNYEAYIKGEKEVKLSIKENFNTCRSDDKVKRCGIIKDTVTNATNLTTKEDLSSYNNKDAIETIKDIINRDKSTKINIQTNWNSRFTKEELESLLKSDKKNITVEIKDALEQTTKKKAEYTVKFDAKNGKKIEEVTVKKDGKIKKPKNPTKKGYTFVEWQLNGKKYDFNKKVKKDLTLVAKWKKKKA